MAETAIADERGERHLEMLAEMAETSMKAARVLGDLVELRAEREKKGEPSPGRSEDAASALAKMAQTLRRTLALEAKFAEGVKARREMRITDGAERRKERAAAHKSEVDEAIVGGLHDAWRVRRPPLDFELRVEEKARKYGRPPSLPPLHGEGQTPQASGWGTLSASANAVGNPTQPHPGCFASGPSP